MWGSSSTREISAAKLSERDRLISASTAAARVEDHEKFLNASGMCYFERHFVPSVPNRVLNFHAVKDIVSRIEAGEWTAVQVVEAYITQAIAAHKATNCITEGA